jgi:biopolymer transport protein ExbB
MMIKSLLSMLALFASLAAALPAHAWWSSDWTGRKKVTLNTAEGGARIGGPVASAVVAIRLHTGNFSFIDAKEDGSDLRFIGADDKTPLKFHIERFDAVNELAVVWVQVPAVAPGAKTDVWMYYGNAKATAAGDAKGTYDGSQLLALHFNEASGLPQDATGFGHHAGRSDARTGAAGVLGGALAFDGKSRIDIAPAPTLRAPAASGVTLTVWAKAAAADQGGQLIQFGTAGQGVSLELVAGRPVARAGAVQAAAAEALKPGTWQQLALVLANGKLALFVGGEEAASASAQAADIEGPVVIGAGFAGELDEVTVAAGARSADWLRVGFASQGGEGRLVAVSDGGAEEAAGDHAYLGVLIDSLTVDAWVVIIICGVMLVVSIFVMIAKIIYIARLDSANQQFMRAFTSVGPDIASLRETPKMTSGSLLRLYRIGMEELRRRIDPPSGTAAPMRSAGAAAVASADDVNLSVQTLGAIQSSMNGGLVRENHKLNSQMVLLTISISGGPFLGLLGTVVGVMITFAAIAAAGDVNVNAIAPGIAAALLATVAGLGVAIPALFGYNYLATRIKKVNADMQVFVEEFMAKTAERYSR